MFVNAQITVENAIFCESRFDSISHQLLFTKTIFKRKQPPKNVFLLNKLSL